MTAKWIQVFVRHEDGGFKITRYNQPFVETSPSEIIAEENELALVPMDKDDRYLSNSDDFYELEAYRTITENELFDLLSQSYVFLCAHIEENQIKPIKLAGKIILKWKK